MAPVRRRHVRVTLRAGGAFAHTDEHVSVCLDDAEGAVGADGAVGAVGALWRDSADVLWSAGPAPSRSAALARARAAIRRHPGALVVCVGYGDGGRMAVVGAFGAAVRAHGVPGPVGPVLVRAHGVPGPVAALAGSLLHAWATARLPLDRPLGIRVAGGVVQLVPGGSAPGDGSPEGGAPGGERSATRAASRSASGAPAPS